VDADWRVRAACRATDPDLFFPVGVAGPALAQIEQAKRVCRRCLVQAECLVWAVSHRVVDGIWGGKTAGERRLPEHSAAKVLSIRDERSA